MKDIIQLLPDHLANQIAAGEVIQRPASVVKELLENAVDAGATAIQLIVKDAGKELIQVVDNGCGMAPMDARMSFERHATSKIKQIDDLFAIRTMGFRGEALASIAAVAQVELKTRLASEEVGTHLVIEASEVKSQSPAACPSGTNFIVRNLFYNVPARRKFLKSNTSEFKHIIDEFSRVAMAYPEISFRLYHNNVEQFHLNTGGLKSRIIGILGSRSEKNLVPISEEAEEIKITGFIGKPEAGSRTRGNQFFFINKRYIRSPYLNHAIVTAFEGLIDKETYPFYVLFFEMKPERVDVNVHPSKQEVKFDDERMMYAFLQAAVKHALAKFNIAPALDFSLNPEIQNLPSMRLPLNEDTVKATQTGYLQHSFSEKGKSHFIEGRNERREWQAQQNAFFPAMPAWGGDKEEGGNIPSEARGAEIPFGGHDDAQQMILAWGSYLVTTVKSGFLLLNHKRALERIIYERLQKKIKAGQSFSQQLLFPIPITIAPVDIQLLEEALPFLKKAGFDISSFGRKDYVIQGAPVDLREGSEQNVVEGILEQVKREPGVLKDPVHERLLITMAKRMSQAPSFHAKEGRNLIDELFACQMPQYTPEGKSVFVILTHEKLNSLL